METRAGKIKATAEKVAAKAEQPLTVLWEQLADWQQDNQYILSGYRPASNSFYKSAASLGYIHNETVNIYTHGVGAVVFAVVSVMLWNVLLPRYQEASPQDVYAFGCFFAGAVGCLGMSATYHLFSNHSRAVARVGNKLDYLGIVLLIWGSFVPTVYYGFQCDPRLIRTYWAMITTFGAGCVLVIATPKVSTPSWRPLRAGMFLAMGLSAVFPVLHGMRLYGIRAMVDLMGLPWVVAQGALYVAGALMYANRVPEALSPGSFDIWGSSHQIFHVLVLLAAFAQLVGLAKAFDYHHSQPLFVTCAGLSS